MTGFTEPMMVVWLLTIGHCLLCVRCADGVAGYTKATPIEFHLSSNVVSLELIRGDTIRRRNRVAYVSRCARVLRCAVFVCVLCVC